MSLTLTPVLWGYSQGSRIAEYHGHWLVIFSEEPLTGLHKAVSFTALHTMALICVTQGLVVGGSLSHHHVCSFIEKRCQVLWVELLRLSSIKDK